MNYTKKILIISKQLDIKPNRSVYLNLAKKGYYIDIIIPNGQTELAQEEKKYLNIINLKSIGKHPRSFFIVNLFLLIKKKKYNHIFIENDISTIICFQVCFFKIFLKQLSISVFTLENIYKNYKFLAIGFLKKLNLKKTLIFFALHILEQFNKKFINRIFVFNQDSYKIHKKKFLNSNIIKIPLGINLSLFKKNEVKNNFFKENNKNKRKKIIIGVFGRIDKKRGSDLIFKLLLKNKSKINFDIILDCFHAYKNNYSTSIIRKYKKNFHNRLHLINPTHDDIVDYIKLCDLIIIPSILTKNSKEQYGRLIVEAKLSNTLIIVSEVGAFPETIQNKNLIFRSNFNSLEKKFERILNMDYSEKKKIRFINYKYSSRYQTSLYQSEKIYEKIE